MHQGTSLFHSRFLSHLPLLLATLGLAIGGVFLLHRADAQARDTVRKHHLEDIEKSLYSAYLRHGTYPPYDQATWCGVLSDPANHNVRAQVEAALRQQNNKYSNVAKPFPADPLVDPRQIGTDKPRLVKQVLDQEHTPPDYFYWKRSPAVFELYSILEAAPSGDRTTHTCTQAANLTYDYGLNSRTRTGTVVPLLDL